MLDVPVEMRSPPKRFGGGSKSGGEATAEPNWFMLRCLENSSFEVPSVTVPQPDTGRQGENPKAFERTPVKELGKLAP